MGRENRKVLYTKPDTEKSECDLRRARFDSHCRHEPLLKHFLIPWALRAPYPGLCARQALADDKSDDRQSANFLRLSISQGPPSATKRI